MMDFTPVNNRSFEALSEAMPSRIRANARSIIFELLCSARRKAGTLEGYELERGDVKISIRKLPESTGASRQSCRTVLKHLKECGFLTHKQTHPDLIVTILDFNSYISDNLDNNPPNNPPPTHHQPTSHLKEVVKEKREKNLEEESREPRRPQDDYEVSMEGYWLTFAPGWDIPWKKFDLWRQHFPEDAIVAAALHCALRSDEPADPLRYLPSLFAAAQAGELKTQKSSLSALPNGSPQTETTQERIERRRRERQERFNAKAE